MHTLKGMAGLFGFQEVTDISHALESLLDDVRLGKIDMTNDTVVFLLRFIDVLRSLVEGMKTGKSKTSADVSAYLNEIESFRESVLGKAEAQSLKGIIDDEIIKVLSEYEEHRLNSNLKDGKGIYMAKTVFTLEDFDNQLKEITEKIKGLGELVSTMPTAENIPDGYIGFNLMIGTHMQSVELAEELKFGVVELAGSARDGAGVAETVDKETVDKETVDKETVDKETVDKETVDKETAEADVQDFGTMKTASATVRVDIGKLDRILNTIGELGITNSSLGRLWFEMSERFGHGAEIIDLYSVRQNFGRRLVELQGQVLSIRMVPVGQIFQRLGQVVRRYSRNVGKKLTLQVFGEDTEIDKSLAEEVIDPLVHLVRNAIDHGIEPAEIRKESGKNEAGSIVLRAFQRGNSVVIEVEDDGRGIDIEKIRQKAAEKGLIGPDEELEDREVVDIMFAPGFSTTDAVSEVSGRGVGLDIVKNKLSSMGGLIDVFSEKGRYSTFVLTLPITLAIVKALFVKVGEERFAIPLSTISETLVIEHENIQTIENREVIELRGEMIPLSRLRKFLGLPEADIDRSFALVIGVGDRRMGLLVDDFFGQHDVVIKSLGDYFEGLKGFAGAAEIGEHEVVLVLDVEAAVDELHLRKAVSNV
jgi:two-component system chemotaxis sensor kinase CheA